MIKMINHMFWVEQVRHESRRCNLAKMLERRAASGSENPKNPWPAKEKENHEMIN